MLMLRRAVACNESAAGGARPPAQGGRALAPPVLWPPRPWTSHRVLELTVLMNLCSSHVIDFCAGQLQWIPGLLDYLVIELPHKQVTTLESTLRVHWACRGWSSDPWTRLNVYMASKSSGHMDISSATIFVVWSFYNFVYICVIHFLVL